MSTRAENLQGSMKGVHGVMDNIEAQDHKVSQSSILYFQLEASKLALPAKVLHYAKSDEVKVPDETPEQRQSPPTTLCPPQFLGGKSGEGNSQPSFSGLFSVLHTCQGSSPWEVMSLINQQCEKLLHSGKADEVEEDFTALATDSPSKGFLYPSSNSNHAESECRENSTSHTLNEIRETYSIVSDRGETGIVDEEVHVAQIITIPDCAIKSPQVTNDGREDGQLNLTDHNYSFSVSTECRMQIPHQEEPMALLCSEVKVVVSPCTESPPQSDQRPTSDCQVDHKLSHSLSRKGDELDPSPRSVMEPGPARAEEGGFKQSFGFALDCNNNIKPLSPSQMMTPPTGREHTGPGISSATLELGLPAGQPGPRHNSLHDQGVGERAEAQTGKAQTPAPAQTAPQPNQWQSRTPRKQAHPSRSADPRNPNLQGVIFSMNTELDDSNNQCRLLITSNYRKELRKRACRRRCRALRLPKEASSSEEESEPCSRSKSKTCASCCTRKTPLWRDAEDGTPLCNACGIRYKKYRVRCTNCWHIPRKDGKSRSKCFKCGDVLRLTSHHKRAGW
ncbi:GATA-type zinc finger protein 1 isoform X2 [Clupea harengus]|uniref:GATA-type zinc finger protein 1 isoform X2 n=1 Tax=Clupea harengus TaxID=7950 RepID=A0A6P8F9R5_CLUHA|nr:GATA-type zinc finger protein 1 isoform X2 [Clupea harengus]